jgi:glycosyltransferase involved in cell wall biosynthesis
MIDQKQSADPIRVLVSAYACEPGKGSEPGVGWNVARELSSRVSLCVITRANNREAIEASNEEWIGRVRWIYWDPPAWLTFWKKGGRGVQLFYMIWQYGVKAVAREALAQHDFDIIHHLTFGKYWIPSRLAGLPRPFVFGPVGGGERTPDGLAERISSRGHLAEIAKRLAIRTVACLPGTKHLFRSAAWTFAATSQTEEAIQRIGVTRMSVLPQSGIRRSDLPQFEPNNPKSGTDELVVVTAARLIHWKAVDLAIEAVAAASKTIPVRLIVLQTGPELGALKDLTRKLGIEDKVNFKGKLKRLEDVYEEISKADVLMHPALHEAFGQACLESLALGVPVICLNWGGPGLIVDSKTGFAVEPTSRELTIERMAGAICELAAERSAGISRKEDCQARAFECFHWENIANQIVSRYQRILSDPL